MTKRKQKIQRRQSANGAWEALRLRCSGLESSVRTRANWSDHSPNCHRKGVELATEDFKLREESQRLKGRGLRSLLHCLGAFDAEESERADEFAQGDRGGGEEECFARGVFFREDVMAMVEVGELLRELEGVLGKIGRLGGGDALLEDRVRRPARSQSAQMSSFSSPERKACEMRLAGSLAKSASTASGVVLPLRKMLRMRTTAY